MRLAVVLSRAADLPLACELTAAARAAGDDVAWFAMDEAVTALCELPRARWPWLEDIDVTLCATSLDRVGLAPPEWSTLGSQDDHAALLAWATHTVALT